MAAIHEKTPLAIFKEENAGDIFFKMTATGTRESFGSFANRVYFGQLTRDEKKAIWAAEDLVVGPFIIVVKDSNGDNQRFEGKIAKGQYLKLITELNDLFPEALVDFCWGEGRRLSNVW